MPISRARWPTEYRITAWIPLTASASAAAPNAAINETLKRRGARFRTPILAVAVGIYLPFGLSVLIFTGGMLSWLAARLFRPRDEGERISLENAGMLLASGLITGEAVTAVLLAVVVVALPGVLPDRPGPWADATALLAVAALVVYLLTRTLGAARAQR